MCELGLVNIKPLPVVCLKDAGIVSQCEFFKAFANVIEGVAQTFVVALNRSVQEDSLASSGLMNAF